MCSDHSPSWEFYRMPDFVDNPGHGELSLIDRALISRHLIASSGRSLRPETGPRDRLTSFTWNSLKHLLISLKCEPRPWPRQCQGTLVPWAKIANLNGFQLSHGWMPAPPACRLPWHFKGLLAGSVTHAEGKAGLWTCGPARLTCTTPRRKQWLPYGFLARQKAGAQITWITQEAGKQPGISLSRVRISATQAARGGPQAA